MKLLRWRGLKSLVHAAVERTVDLVEEGHESVARTVIAGLSAVPGLAAPARLVDDVRRLSTAGVLGTIRGVNRVVQSVTDLGLDAAEIAMDPPSTANEERPVPMRSDTMLTASNATVAAIGLVNGIVGDTLHAMNNGLSLPMQLRLRDRYLPEEPAALAEAITDVTSKIVVFVHGLGTTEWSWCLNAAEYHGAPDANFGTMLARDFGYTPIWVRYNSGRHVSESGRELCARVEALVNAWPVAPTEILLIGHSMGGLVVRSACHYAAEANGSWLRHVQRVFCLGAPHRGAALEQFGHLASALLLAIDTPGTRIPAMLIQGRSAGIKDMRHGSLVDEDWLGRDPDALSEATARQVPLLDGVTYHFVSATVTTDPEHPLGQIIGDMFVRQASASGPVSRQGTFRIETSFHGGVLHHQLGNHPDVYAQIRAALASDNDAENPPSGP